MTDLTQQEALDIWGPVNQQAAKRKAELGEFWKPANGAVEGEITKIYTKPNFDQTGRNPAIDLKTPEGKKVTVELAHAIIRDRVSSRTPRVGDYLKIDAPYKQAGKKAWYAEVTVTRDGKAVEAANTQEPPF
jgi:hypothetical protein